MASSRGTLEVSSAVGASGARGPGADWSTSSADPSEDLALGAAVLLERALDALQDGQAAFAAAALRTALATQDLNDAGRSLAYWYIYTAEELQGHRRASKDALADFVAVADNVLGARETTRYADAGGSDFVDRFDLEGRVARGRALLSVAWAASHHSFGRSADVPVPVRSRAELTHFVELAPGCVHPLDRRLDQQHVQSAGPLPLEQVSFHCQGERAPLTYFFEWH